MKKFKVAKVKGVKVVTKVRKDTNRPAFPRPAVFADRKKYSRKRGWEKEEEHEFF